MLIEKLKELWRGDIPLVKTFWIYNLAIPLLCVFTFGFFYLKWVVLLVTQNNIALAYIAFLAFKLLNYSYGVISAVGLWRSAAKYTGPASWKFLGKATVVFSVMWIF